MREYLTKVEMHISPVKLACPEAQYRKYFSSTEWKHIQLLQDDKMRRERLYGRIWFKNYLLSHGLCIPPSKVVLDERLGSKQCQDNYLLSLAHAGGWCFCVVAHKGASSADVNGVGCDIEETSRLGQEIRWIKNCADNISKEDYHKLWVIKEACYKAIPNNVELKLSDIVVNSVKSTATYKQCELKYELFPFGQFICAFALCRQLQSSIGL